MQTLNQYLLRIRELRRVIVQTMVLFRSR